MRSWCLNYIKRRREGSVESSVTAKADLLSLMLERPDVFTDEIIADELLAFLGAGSESSGLTTRTIITYLSKTPESLRKIRDEFNVMKS